MRKVTLVVVICDTFIALLAAIYVSATTFAAELIVHKTFFSSIHDFGSCLWAPQGTKESNRKCLLLVMDSLKLEMASKCEGI